MGDIFLPNEIEALLLTHSRTLEEALPELTQLGPLVVVKRGAKGAIAVNEHGIVEMPAISVQPVDTTGAGDCFNAGFLYGWLQRWPLSQCLRAGNICGGLSTTSPGGSTASPALAELTDWLINENER
ncbi:MAG TPA: hypothetical protein EYH31_07425 [Anaerolineae bacterium]|nr:hypothetical protein [Anaerolineae bacterium]